MFENINPFLHLLCRHALCSTCFDPSCDVVWKISAFQSKTYVYMYLQAFVVTETYISRINVNRYRLAATRQNLPLTNVCEEQFKKD